MAVTEEDRRVYTLMLSRLQALNEALRECGRSGIKITLLELHETGALNKTFLVDDASKSERVLPL